MKIKSKAKVESSGKKITSIFKRPVWTTYPAIIACLQNQRESKIHPKNQNLHLYEKNRGLNATIILLSALTIEGFLVDCLSCFTMGSEFSPMNSFESRLNHAFRKITDRATFGEFQELFRIALGAPLSEMIKDKKLIEGIKALINFRNGLAHARSVVYKTYEIDLEQEVDYEVESQYAEVHTYLKKLNLVYKEEDFYINKIADHFADLVKPYINAVIPLLPVPQSDNVIALVRFAYTRTI